jgi:hypothetical protein
MTLRLVALLVVTAAFAVLTVTALVDVGYFGIIEPAFEDWGPAQVFTDLVIVCLLAIVWMVGDARQRGLNPWPFVVLTLAGGSFGPLAYLIVCEWRAGRTRPATA